MSEHKLLSPCPFCGEEIYYYFPFAGADFDGHCRNKNCFMYGIEITFGDVAKYNTRPIEDELNARIAQLEAERNKLAEAVGLMTTLKPTMVVDSAHPVEMALEVSEYITQLTAERNELEEKLDKRLYQLYMIDLAKTQNELDEWKADAERFIQLANFNNKKASEYFELHEQLVAKYGGEK